MHMSTEGAQMLQSGDGTKQAEGDLWHLAFFIFDMMNWFSDMGYSDVLKKACENGCTEQNPCGGLAGTDTAYNYVIIRLALEDIKVRIIYPRELEYRDSRGCRGLFACAHGSLVCCRQGQWHR